MKDEGWIAYEREHRRRMLRIDIGIGLSVLALVTSLGSMALTHFGY